eukprot:2868368-Pleurochrysis_carterae.AAC.4
MESPVGYYGLNSVKLGITDTSAPYSDLTVELSLLRYQAAADTTVSTASPASGPSQTVKYGCK